MGRVRVEAMTKEDEEKLRQRIIPLTSDGTHEEQLAKYYVDLARKDPRAMALFATNAEVTTFNKNVVEALGMETFTIEAEESEKISAHDSVMRGLRRNGKDGKDKLTRPYQKGEFSIRKPYSKRVTRKLLPIDESGRLAGGLQKHLILAIGARYTIRDI